MGFHGCSELFGNARLKLLLGAGDGWGRVNLHIGLRRQAYNTPSRPLALQKK